MKPTSKNVRTLVQTIELAVLFPDDVRKVVPIRWQKGLMVLDACNRAEANPHGPTFTIVGSGKYAFVRAIDEESEIRDTRYWMFTVNGEFRDEGCGKCELKPGDIVCWQLVEYDADLAKQSTQP